VKISARGIFFDPRRRIKGNACRRGFRKEMDGFDCGLRKVVSR